MKIYKVVPFKFNNDYCLTSPYTKGPCDFCVFNDKNNICSKRFICNLFDRKVNSYEITLFFIEK